MVVTEDLIYQHGNEELKGFLAKPEHITTPLPAILIVHDWTGCNDLVKERAKAFALQGYIGFAVDMYGEGRTGQTNEEKQALMGPLLENRNLLKERMHCALSRLKEIPDIKADAIAAIGFCFGGLCVLDLARTGADLKAVVSFHGLLHSDKTYKTQPIKASILALHGYQDPMVKPQQVIEFANEMDEYASTWEMMMFGHTSHAFTNPLANQPEFGLIYKPEVARKAFRAMHNLFEDVLS